MIFIYFLLYKQCFGRIGLVFAPKSGQMKSDADPLEGREYDGWVDF
jgi:hypothetical protein